MKLFFIIIWALILGIFTCTGNLGALLHYSSLSFSWNPHPSYWDLFKLFDINKIHRNWILVKFGHLIGFLILDALLFNLFHRQNISVIISIVFAIATEILQLYFNRDGRIYDMIIDSLGVISFSLIVQFSRKFLKAEYYH